MTQLPPLNALRAFEVAGRCLNFRLAADEMGVTQGAVAQQVRLLEAHLGVQLFERLPKGLAFTATGRGCHAHVASAFGELRTGTATLRPDPGNVLVSVTPTFAAKWLIPNLPAFSEAHPDVDLRILATEKLSNFQGDGIDLAIRQAQPPFGASLEVFRMFRQDVIAVAAPRLLAASETPQDPAVLERLPKLHDAHNLWPEFLKRVGLEDRSGRGLRLSQAALTIDAAVAGQGVALADRFLAAREIEAGQLLQVTSASLRGEQDFYLLADRRKKRRPTVEIVFQWFVSKAEAASPGGDGRLSPSGTA